MPCYSPPVHKDEFGNWKDGEIPQDQFDKLVRMLCEANRIIDEIPHEKRRSRSRELATWWVSHQEFDRARKAIEEAKQRKAGR
jgi:hypothetical protein